MTADSPATEATGADTTTAPPGREPDGVAQEAAFVPDVPLDPVDGPDGAEPVDRPEVEDTVRRPRGLLALIAVLLVVAVVAATLAAVFYGKWRSERDSRREVRAAASGVVVALTTYDYTNLDDFHRRVLAGATGKFRQEFEDAFAPLKDSLTRTQVRSVGTVRKVYLSDTGGNAAEAIVIADQVVTASGSQRPVQGQQLTVSLVHVGGAWKVDGLTYDVPSGDSGGTGPPTTPTSR
jgi:Mce-associated membrane protein